MTSRAQAPKREMRGAWIATFSRIDWPGAQSVNTPALQQAALITILNHHQQTGINTIYFQVRSQCDAMYASTIEPWSSDLTGSSIPQGTPPNPFWDPLQFVITECHKRNMKLHAWINPYRAVSNVNNLPGFHVSHVAKQHPEWLLASDNLRILDPGIPAVRTYVRSVIQDIVNRYDVDGIHFDDYFYPTTTYNDDNTFNADPRGFTNRSDWRRDNINQLIQGVYNDINAAKPWVQFGVSPSGIYRNGTANGGSATTGSQHYSVQHADSRRWMQEGWVDYLCPQVYWFIGQTGADYSILIPWWNNNAFGRHLYIGMAGYKVGDASVTSNGLFITDNTMIPQEMRLNRNTANIQGQAIYNTNSLRSNRLGFRDSLRLFFFNKPALLPTMPWKDNTPPGPASALLTSQQGSAARLSFTPPAATANEMDKVWQFALYRSTSASVDINNADNLLAILHADSTGYTDNTVQVNTTYYYTLTALDRFHNESAVSNTASITIGVLPLQLVDFTVQQQDDRLVRLKWQTTAEENTSHFTIERSVDGISYSFVKNIAAANRPGGQEYTSTDNIILYNAPIYYRLKMVDRDDRFTYSPVRSVTIGHTGDLVKVYPTLLRNGEPLQVQLLQSTPHALPWIIYDAMGHEIQGGMLSATSAGSRINVPVKTLAHGWYIFQLTNGRETQSSRFLIQ